MMQQGLSPHRQSLEIAVKLDVSAPTARKLIAFGRRMNMTAGPPTQQDLAAQLAEAVKALNQIAKMGGYTAGIAQDALRKIQATTD